MEASEPSAAGAIPNLNQFVALNDELGALVRAGIPLERGLLAASGDHGGRFGAMLGDLARRLDAGERLPDALGAAFGPLPAAYRAMVEAGLRSGRLADSLQGLARIGQAMVEARRTIALAFFYPLVVVALAYGLALFFLVAIVPRFVAAAATFRLDPGPFLRALDAAGRSAPTWGPVFPALVVVGLLGWAAAGRLGALGGGMGLGSPAARLPGVGRIIADYRVAHFVDLLARLVEHDVPLDEAVRLAGEAAGAADLRDAAARLAAHLAAGGVGAAPPGGGTGALPPLLGWMLAGDHRQGRLAAGLGQLAATYRRRADRRAQSLRIVLPGALLVTVGAAAVLAYGLLLFVPLRQLWDGLASPLN